MEQSRTNETFHYSYSAKEQDEIQMIRKKYESPKEDKMAQLRRLDESVTRKATIYSLVVGIVGALILGLGMSLIMTELYASIGIAHSAAMGIGIGIGVPGLVLVGIAYPVYNRVVKKEREKIAPEILSLADELMK